MWMLVAGIVVLLFGVAAFFGAPYVPSQRRYVERAFKELYPLGKDDVLVDIGAGDGLVLRAGRRFDAAAVGYEINPLLVLIAKLLSWNDKRVNIYFGNFWRADLPKETTVVYAFSVLRDGPRLMRKLQRTVDATGKSLVLLSYGNPLPDKEPDTTFEAYYRYTFHPLQGK